MTMHAEEIMLHHRQLKLPGLKVLLLPRQLPVPLSLLMIPLVASPVDGSQSQSSYRGGQSKRKINSSIHPLLACRTMTGRRRTTAASH